MTNKLSDPTLAKLSVDRDQRSSFDALAYEQQNVHSVYQEIASHFSHTRYKPWPLIPAFLSTLPSGSIGIDLGCGNGKYLHLRSTLAPGFLHPSNESQQSPNNDNSMNILTIGADRSSNLIDLALQNYPEPKTFGPGPGIAWNPTLMKERNEVAVADALQSGFRSKAFDYAISIATIHHFSTHERRRKAIKELIRLVRPIPRSAVSRSQEESTSSDESDPSKLQTGHGRFMVYAWALEQRGETRRTWDEKREKDQDGTSTAAVSSSTTTSKTTCQADRSEESANQSATTEALDNLKLESEEKQMDEQRSEDRSQQDVLVPWVIPTHLVKGGKKKKGKVESAKNKEKGKGKVEVTREGRESASLNEANTNQESRGNEAKESGTNGSIEQKEDHPVYQRYYHVFRSGELEELVEEAATEMFGENQKELTVERQAGGWEKGNWWGIWQIIQEDK